jgi:triosephosphate isomerase
MIGRRPLVAGNWKMHHDHLSAISVVQRLVLRLSEQVGREAEVCVMPAFTALRSLQVLLEDDAPVVLGAQNCHQDDRGAFTGEVAAPMLAKLGVRYVLAGHSERRQLYGETDELVAAKVAAIVRHGMTPVLCIGESREEREAGRTTERLRSQLTGSLRGIAAEAAASLVVAYEPIWAIGTGLAAEPLDATEAAGEIRAALADLYSSAVATTARILYGGSVTERNASELMAGADVDGVLVGGASLDGDSLAAIADAAPRGRWRP